MNILERIDDCIASLPKEKLSLLTIRVISLCEELNDLENWLILNELTIRSTSNKSVYDDLRKNFKDLCDKKGKDFNYYKDTFNASTKKILDIRKVDKDSINMKSIYELENDIQNVEADLSSLTLPEGLNPLDLYFENQRISKTKIEVNSTLRECKNRYSQYQTFVAKVLQNLRTIALESDNMKYNEKGDKEMTKNVFIIHGHNEAKWRELQALLKDEFGLNPIILSEKPNSGLTIIEKFEKYAKNCSYAFAIFTPDDIVENNGKSYFQARPNVIFELGWFYAKLGRNGVCILDQECEQSEIFSDLQGIMRIQFKNNVKEAYSDIKKNLKKLQ